MAINKRIINPGFEAPLPPLTTSFNTVTYTGNGTPRSITGVGFQPDLVWIKDRDTTGESHRLNDSVRGVGKPLYSNGTFLEGSEGTTGLTAFNSDGFSIGNATAYNNTGKDYVAWNFKAGGSAVTNTDGTITSQVSANTEAGFSVVSYTGTGSSNTIVGTGLNTECDFVIIKNRNNTEGSSWVVQRNKTDKTKYLYLNDTRAESTSTAFQVDINTNNGTFKIDGTSRGVNTLNDNFIAYCFAEVAGFSKFGSYTGNGSTSGPIITTDFEPAFLLVKRTNAAEDWVMLDNKRDTTNPRSKYLFANSSDAEGDLSVLNTDFNSNNFQLKTSWTGLNASGSTYIYMAFANQF